MLQIDNHEEQALSVVIPYLLQFPEIYGLAQNSGNRAQNIEDVAWELLWDLDVDTAEGIWLDYLGKKVGQSRVYSPTVEGAFTFGGTSDEGFGSGKFLSSALTGSNTKIARTDALFRNAIKAKILQNNTDCSLDELINSCKLLYNAELVLVNEGYPAGIESIYLYGSSLLESSNANDEIKKMIPAGVSLTHVYFINAYNIFRNNAFISYGSEYLIPATDDFELSFSFNPTQISSSDTCLLSEATLFSEEPIVKICYNNTDGVIFNSTPDYYVDGFGLPYLDGLGDKYYSNEGAISLSGGAVNLNENNTVKITKVGTTYTLYVNDMSVDSVVSSENIGGTEAHRLYLGVAESSYYNSGSINNLYIYNSTTSTIILNDSLKLKTNFGTNNGVIFL